MAALRLAIALLATAAARPAQADPVARWQPMIAEASRRFGIPQDWIARVIRAESAGQTELGGRPIRSSAGAIGLMQLMPATWLSVRQAHGLGADPDDPRDNILAGTAYLRLLYDRFGYPGLFGAYNAGPARYAAWLKGHRRLPGETIAYLGALAGPGKAAGITGSTSPPQLLFALRHDLGDPSERATGSLTESGLFAIRKRSE